MLLPVELERYILLFIVHGDMDLADQKDVQNTLIAFSSVCWRFRALALPFMFQSFPPLSLNKDGKLKPFTDKRPLSSFLRAWQSSDPQAECLTHHIRHATLGFTDAGSVFEWPETIRKSYANDYMSSLLHLPNLSTLTLSNVLFDPTWLAKLLKQGRLTSLAIKASRSSLTFRKALVDMAHIILTHGQALTRLDVQGHPLVHALLTGGSSALGLTHLAIRRTFIHTADLEGFLQHTPSLVSLQLDVDRSIPPPKLSEGDLPHLSDLACPESWFPVFLAHARPIVRCVTVESASRCEDSMSDFVWDVPVVESAPVTYTAALVRSGTTRIKDMHVSLTMALMDWSGATPDLESLKMYVCSDASGLYPLLQLSLPKLGQGNGTQPKKTWSRLESFKIGYDHVPCTSPTEFPLDLVRQRSLLPLLLGSCPNVRRVQLSPYVSWSRSSDEWTPSIRGERWREILALVRASDGERLRAWREVDVLGRYKRLIVDSL